MFLTVLGCVYAASVYVYVCETIIVYTLHHHDHEKNMIMNRIQLGMIISLFFSNRDKSDDNEMDKEKA